MSRSKKARHVGWAFVLCSSLLRAGEPESSIVRGPYLQALSDSSVEIRWVTDSVSEGVVLVRDPDGAEIAAEVGEGTSHVASVDGLRASTLYSYVVRDGDRALTDGDDFRFETAPPPGAGTLLAFAIGDSGVGGIQQIQLGAIMSAYDVPMILHTGDVAYFPDLDRVFFRPYEQLVRKSCFFVARGNHDLELRDEGIVWRDHFAVPTGAVDERRHYFSYDWGPVHFLVLDYFSKFADDSEQDAFALADLEAARARDVPWLVVYLHVPIFSIGRYGNLDHPLRDKLPGWCDRFGVDVVFSGHDHNYQRSHPVRGHVVHDAWQGDEIVEPQGTVYVITGGGGVGLYRRNRFPTVEPFMSQFAARYNCVYLEATPETFSMRAIALSTEGREEEPPLDVVTLRKGAPRPPFRILRGDANSDLQLDVSDPVAILESLFVGGDLLCQPAATAKGEGSRLLITDAIYLLTFLFGGGPPPEAPFPDCGADHAVIDAFCYASSCEI